MSIKDWPASERPREKLLQTGAASLSDAELLAIFLRTGMAGMSAVDLARSLLADFGSLRSLLGADCQRFCQAKGLGEAKFVQLQACIELSQRYLAEEMSRDNPLTNPEATRRYLQSRLRDEVNEVFAMLLLDKQHRVLKFDIIFQGTIDQASVYPRVLVQKVLAHNAAAVILSHNHPSGIAEPSESDKQITEKVIAALDLIDVPVLDHLVIGESHCVSFAERGWI